MKGNIIRAFIATGALASLCAASGCVADRPSRNGVFNENQYVRKDFLVRPGNGGTDPGWFLKTTVVSASTPNPLGPSQAQLWPGVEAQSYVNFSVTSDRLNMNNMIMLSADQTPTGSINAQGTRNQETIDSWPVTNVDLKYRVNLDGEKTNFYEENQELDWQLRQWVKLSFDKNDQSDLATYGALTNEFLSKCTDVSNVAATLHPGSFYVDEPNNYFQFAVDVTVPIVFNSLPSTSVSSDGTTVTNTTSYDTYCSSQFGYDGWLFQHLGRTNVSLTVMYSFMRASEDPATTYDGGPLAQKTYMPLVVPEHDNIQHKYGMLFERLPARDNNSGLLGSRQLAMRHDPKAPTITYYFAPGWPNQYKWIFGLPDKAGCTDACTFSGKIANGGIVEQTNALLAKAGATAKVVVKDYDADLADGQPPRAVGDVRYSFLRWMSDLDMGQGWLGVEQFYADPRSGQALSASINMADFGWQDYVLARMDYYEQSIGAFNFGANGSCVLGAAGEKICVPATCTVGQTMPLVPQEIQANHNGSSTLFQKMQQYLGRPVSTWGNLGPTDFIVQHDQNFYDAFNAVIPYQVFADPGANAYVIPEGGSANYGSTALQMAAGAQEAQFQDLMSKIDKGWAPFDPEQDLATGGQQSTAYLAQLQQLTLAHRDYQYISRFAHPNQLRDDLSMISLPGIFSKDARHCTSANHWETRDEYVKNLISGYYALIWWHEFGHSMGLDHNFMGSVDRANFPHYTDAAGDHIGLYSSSVMEYNDSFDRVFWAGSSANGGVKGQPGWAPYDQAAIAFIYSNNATTMNSLDAGKPTGEVGASVSGQSGMSLTSGKPVDKTTARWNDPLGYCPGTGTAPVANPATGGTCMPNQEIQFLWCSDSNTKYSPFCRTFDVGTTPSEIIANEIDAYEWEYLWRNFPQYHQYFSFAGYGNGPAQFFTEGRRFLSSWAYDWSQGELSDNFRRLNVNPPAGIPEATYYDDLSTQFNLDISTANQLYAATSQGIIQQSSGQRPFITKTDPFFGDTIQQGIAIDKNLSLQAFTALWQVDNYDQNQAAGAYLAPFSFGDPSYGAVAEAACLSMIGGQYNMFLYAIPLGVQQFAQATHSAYFQEYATGSRPEMKDWIGGYTFTRYPDFLDFFRRLAVQYNTVDATGKPLCGIDPSTGLPNDTVASCTYDPTIPAIPEDPEAGYHSDPFQQFIGPDYRRWIWVYLQDMNTWIVADRDRNVATYIMMYNYTTDIIYGQDDGNTGPAYAVELPLKYFLDYYKQAGN